MAPLRPLRPEIQWRAWYVMLDRSPVLVDTIDNTMRSPADCPVEGVLTITQRSSDGRTMDHVPTQSCYAFLDLHQMWTGTTPEEIATYPGRGILYSAVINAASLPTEIYRNAMEWPYTDDDFPSMAPEDAFGIATEDRYNAAILRERIVRRGRPSSLLNGI